MRPFSATCLLERKNGELVAGTSTDGLLLVKDLTAPQMPVKLQGAGEIRSMAEDNAGGLWNAAENGVYSYDGKHAKQYMNNADGTKYYSVCTDMTGCVYVGTAIRVACRKHRLIHSISSSSFSRPQSLVSLPPPP